MSCEHRKARCRTCESRKYRAKHQMKYAYDTLRTNCVRRKGIGWFELTFEEFAQFAIETRYIAGKGRTKVSYTIDRIDNTMGYFIGNIKVQTNSYNSSKRTKNLIYEWNDTEHRMVAYVSEYTPNESESDGPF